MITRRSLLTSAAAVSLAGAMTRPAKAESDLPVAKVWFETKTVEPGLELIIETHVDPFGRCNIWFLRGRDRDLLIDTGTGLRPLLPNLSVTPGKPLIALSTHAHFDHVGGLHEFETRGLHAAEAAEMATMPDTITYADFMRKLEKPVTALPSAGWTPDQYKVTPTQINLVLNDGDKIDLGDKVFTVLHLPGHSPGSIGLYEPVNATLFSGDCVYDGGGLIDDFANSSKSDYVKSMTRLRELPTRIVHAGHDPSFDEKKKIAIIDGYLAGSK